MTRDTGPGPAPLLSAGDGGGVKAGERLSRVTLAVNTEHDAGPHCSAANCTPASYWAHTGRGKMGSRNYRRIVYLIQANLYTTELCVRLYIL